MLLNDFYTLTTQDFSPEKLQATLTFNRTHKIFEGHFPGLPVVPGVCMMQIVREVTELAVARTLRIAAGDNLKFLAVINPDEQAEVSLTITYKVDAGAYHVNATLYAGTVTFFKFKGTLQES